jgi:hypothetical protein
MQSKSLISGNVYLIKHVMITNVLVTLIIFSFITNGSIITNVLADDPGNFTYKWTTNFGQYSSWSSPVAEDINGDGLYEIFQGGRVSAGIGTVICVNGSSGNLIWQKNFTSLSDRHIPVTVGDLNGDGVYELVHAAGTNTIARYASNGTIFWNSPADSGWSVPAIADLDDSGIPYVIVGDNSAFGNPVTLSKLYGNNGTVAASTNAISYTCYGGVSIADLDRDGEFEIMMSDSGDSICFDENLNILWSTSAYTSESHCAVLTNVTGDGNLEVIMLQQDMVAPYDGGIHVYYANGSEVPGMNDGTLGLGCHCQPAVYDIDKDDHVEVLTSYAGTYCSVWDLTDWSEDATLERGGEPPDIANVLGDSDLEIISPAAWEDGQVDIYDSSYNNVAQIGGYGNPMYGMNTVTQDVDGDELNEIIISGPGEGDITVYDTLAISPTPRVRTDTPYYSERRTNAGVYIPKIGGKCLLSNPNPSDSLNDVSVSTTTLSVIINEPDGDPIDWTIETIPDIGSSSGTNQNNGTKTCTISGLSQGTTYTWYVNVTDGTNWKHRTYSFTTEDDSGNDEIPPQISGVSIVTSNPLDTQINFGWENISCIVTDNEMVSTVLLHITNPDDSATNVFMAKKSGTNTFYSNGSFNQGGTYHYIIQATDTSNNDAFTSNYMFWLPVNWDINSNGLCSILDLVMVSNHYSLTGNYGWIREDVDNNGIVNILDLNLISNHYGNN